MATEFVLRPTVSRSSKKTKSIIIIAGVFLTFIVGSSVFVTLNTSSTGLSSSPTKQAICTAKVLELSQQGKIREVNGYYGGIYECTLMHGFSSVYGKASM